MREQLPKPRPDRVIVEEIISELEPPALSEQKAIELIVGRLELIRKAVPLWAKLSDRRNLGLIADRLNSASSELEKALQDAPIDLLIRIFAKPAKRIFAKNLDKVFRRRCAQFAAQLVEIRYASHETARQKPNVNVAKDECAVQAVLLMRELSRHKITSTSSGRFRSIAGLLYEALSGLPDSHMKRACDKALKQFGSTGAEGSHSH
jgi:hypothetical protein